MQLSSLPNGTLICARNHNRYKWYQSNGHTKTYIPKCNRKLAEDLALKQYYTCLLHDMETEKTIYQNCLKRLASSTSKSEKFINNSEIQKLLAPHFTPISQDLSKWMAEQFEYNMSNPENLVHKSISGHILRSKAEAMIDMLLFQAKIPFRYECALHIGKHTLYPDFTIRHPLTGETYYWEHFGMMDNPVYTKKAFSKLHLYTSNNIIPSIHLITTYETKEHPLSLDYIERIIEEYFL